MDKIIHKRVFMGTKANGKGIVKATADIHQLGNQEPYFSITTGNGCQHDLILESMPHLQPLVDLHLSDQSGAPMHAVANAAYQVDQNDDKALAKHLRIPSEEARELINDFTWYERDKFMARALLVRTIRTMWEGIHKNRKLPKFGTYMADYTAHIQKAAIQMTKFVNGEYGTLILTEPEVKQVNTLLTFGKFKRSANGLRKVLEYAGWTDIQEYIMKLNSVEKIMQKALEKEVTSYARAQEYMTEVIDSCFRSYWLGQALAGIEMLQGEDEHLDATIEEGDPVLKIHGEKFVPEEVHTNYGYLNYVDCGDRNYYIAESSEEAGNKAREYWVDMAKGDPSEFECMVGAETLVKWAMGQKAGPGTTKVCSLEEWFDLYLDVPQEQWASYDGEEVKAYANLAMMLKLEYTETDYGDLKDSKGWVELVAYRA